MPRNIIWVAFAALSAAPALAAEQAPRPIVCSELIAESIPSACLKALAEQQAEARADQSAEHGR